MLFSPILLLSLSLFRAASASISGESDLTERDLEANLEKRGTCPPHLRWDPKTHKCYSPARHPSQDNCNWLGKCYNKWSKKCYDCTPTHTCPPTMYYDWKTKKCFQPCRHPSKTNCQLCSGSCYKNGACVDCSKGNQPNPIQCPQGTWYSWSKQCCVDKHGKCAVQAECSCDNDCPPLYHGQGHQKCDKGQCKTECSWPKTLKWKNGVEYCS